MGIPPVPNGDLKEQTNRNDKQPTYARCLDHCHDAPSPCHWCARGQTARPLNKAEYAIDYEAISRGARLATRRDSSLNADSYGVGDRPVQLALSFELLAGAVADRNQEIMVS